MNIVRVPFRVSLFGGGTDFEYFYSKKKATVISFTIDRYCYITIRELLPFNIFDQRLLKTNMLKVLKDRNIEIHTRTTFLKKRFCLM